MKEYLMHNNRSIVHIDMDAFFASVEQRDNPALRGKPVVVGADPKGGTGRGVVATCSYEARQYGIHSAMPISIAYKKCPQAVFVSPRMKKYSDVSRQVYDILYDFTPFIEQVSIDEFFLDLRGGSQLFGNQRDTCIQIKARIKKELNLTASVGIAPVKMAAKIASDLEKPDGLVEVAKDKLLEFLWPLDIRKVWGLGKKTGDFLKTRGIKTIGDLARQEISYVRTILGKNGDHFWNLANGIDQREVETDEETKSVSNEITFDRDTSDQNEIVSALMRLSEKVSLRLRKYAFMGKTVTLKIRLEGFQTFTRAKTLSEPTNYADVIFREIKKSHDNFGNKHKKVRLVGVKVSHLSQGAVQEDLFELPINKKREKLHSVIDDIQKKFGTSSIVRATGLSAKDK